ncbi:MAG: sigma-70 family RNA polymerase sigma factor [Planctomycetes bacterium]|nr:sigma-70 family RNA polymerase sigma factor [Planctomycetota bacterium]
MLAKEEITAVLLSDRLPLMAFIATVTRNYHLAEDVFQDVCVKAMGRDAEFESAKHLLNWARLTGRNRAIDLLRVRDGKYEGLSEGLLDSLAIVWPDRQGGGRERQVALEHCLESLTPNNRELLRLRYFEGRSGIAVAQALGRKLETVYQALARIHKSLAQCIQQRLLTLEGEA